MQEAAFFAHVLVIVGAVVGAVAERVRKNRERKRHNQWVAARRAARIELEARMREEGRWNNQEISQAMRVAGDAVYPGHRP